MQKKVTIKLVHSTCNSLPKHRATIKGLGLRKLQQERELIDTPEVRGMIRSVAHLVRVLK